MRLRRPTEIRRLNLDKVLGERVVDIETAPSEQGRMREVRLIIPPGVVVALSFTQRPTDIASGARSYDWPELEGPQTNLVIPVRSDQELWALLSSASPDGLAPRCAAIISYPDALPE